MTPRFAFILAPILLVASNIFMTDAWYGHLKDFKSKPLWIAIGVSWLVAFLEYCLQVPANRIGFQQAGFTLVQLKIMQEVITMCVFAAFAVFAIKTLSGAITNILLEVGPLMIAFAALPGLTTRYLAAWCMALIEVTAWGPIAGIILSLLARVNAKSAGVAILEDANYAEHIVLNFVYAGLFLAVPAITHMILSGTASSVGSTGMAAAMGGLAAAGKTGAKAAGAAVDGGAAAGKAALQATGSAADKAATRIGDAATGGATQGTMDAASRQMASAMVGNDVADQKQDARDLHAKRGAIEKQRRGDG